MKPSKESPAAREGRLDGTIDGLNSNMRGARGAFMRRPDLAESDWPAYHAAYDAAVVAESRRFAS